MRPLVHVVIGTRAQLIKMVPVMHAMKEMGWDYNFVFFAQHKATIFEMLDDFGLKHPDYVIADDGVDIVSSLQMVWWSIRALVEGFWHRKRVFLGDRNGIALVHGDAPPLFLGAVIAKAQGLRVAQVEAGLRSYDFRRPFPEEATRVGTAKLGLIDIHFCQNESALKNAQGYPGKKVLIHGNTIADTLTMVSRSESSEPGGFALVSLHRYEMLTDSERLRWTVSKLREIASQTRLLFVLHPATRVALVRNGLLDSLEKDKNIELRPRMTFAEFQQAMAKAKFLISDGGGNQEETAYLGVPCLLFREVTERDEGLHGNVVLSEFNEKVIERFLSNPEQYRVKTPLNGLSPTRFILQELKTFSE